MEKSKVLKAQEMIDINCDMGEGTGNDEQLMPFIDSANIACGGHAGDENSIRHTLKLVARWGKKAGAHPSFPDRKNFGRQEMLLNSSQLYQVIQNQVQAFLLIAQQEQIKCRHIKPHGALYNLSARDASTARVIANAVKDIDPNLILFGLSGSHSISEARAIGLATANEAFADRGYTDNGRLADRSLPEAVFTETGKTLQQVTQLCELQSVQTMSGKTISMPTDTICIHGDGSHAVEFARTIHRYIQTQKRAYE